MENKKTDNIFYKICEYNRLFVITQLAKMLKKDGAIILQSIYAKKTKINIQNYFVGHGFCDVSQECKDKIEKYYKNGFFWVSPWLSLEFILNGFYYSFSPNDNQFMGGTYAKIKIAENGEYINHRYIKSFNDLDNHEKGIYNGYALASCGLGDNSFKIQSKQHLKTVAKHFYNSFFKDLVLNAKECTKTYKTPMQRTNIFNIFDKSRKAVF